MSSFCLAGQKEDMKRWDNILLKLIIYIIYIYIMYNNTYILITTITITIIYVVYV